MGCKPFGEYLSLNQSVVLKCLSCHKKDQNHIRIDVFGARFQYEKVLF